MNTSEAQEVLKNARAAYDKGDISREDALDIIGRAVRVSTGNALDRRTNLCYNRTCA